MIASESGQLPWVFVIFLDFSSFLLIFCEPDTLRLRASVPSNHSNHMPYIRGSNRSNKYYLYGLCPHCQIALTSIRLMQHTMEYLFKIQ